MPPLRTDTRSVFLEPAMCEYATRRASSLTEIAEEVKTSSDGSPKRGITEILRRLAARDDDPVDVDRVLLHVQQAVDARGRAARPDRRRARFPNAVPSTHTMLSLGSSGSWIGSLSAGRLSELPTLSTPKPVSESQPGFSTSRAPQPHGLDDAVGRQLGPRGAHPRDRRRRPSAR